MKSKIQQLKFINKIDVSKAIKNIQKVKCFLLILVTVTILISCSSDDSNSQEVTVQIPDANFEQYLIDENIDSDGVVNGLVLAADVEGVTSLSMNNKNISDLTGIENFTALTSLIANTNSISSIQLIS
mgnify:CR=1 FL=1